MSDFCRNLALEVSSGKLSREELAELTAALDAEKKRMMASDGLEKIEAKLMERGRVIAQDVQLAALIEKRNRLQNVLVETRLLAMADQADAMTGEPALGLQAAMVGVNTPIEGAQRSVDALAQGAMVSYAGGLVADLKDAGLLIKFNKMGGDFERQVARAMYDLNLKEPTGKVDASPDAKKIAAIMQKYQRAAMERENRAGAYIRQKQGYIVRQSHDPGRMTRDKAGWKAEGRQRFDFAAMDIAPDAVEDFLDSAYKAITTGIRLDQQINDIDVAFTGPGNLAKKASASRVIEFKSADDWFDYDQKFGRASLREAFMGDLSRASRNTAIMTNMGTNPRAMLDRVKAKLERKYRDQPEKLTRFAGGVENLDSMYAEISGEVNFGADGVWARRLSGFRALQTMAKLGGAWVSSLSDIAYMAANRTYQGRSMLDAWQDAFSAGAEGLKGGDKRRWADLLGAGLEGQLGDFMSRFNAQDSVSGRTSKAMSLFFKLNLLGPWTDANKRGVTFMISRDLALEAANDFASLPDDMQRMLRLYGFDARKWDVARMAVAEGPDGRAYMMPSEVTKASGAVFTGMTRAQQDKLREEVKESLFALMTNEADFAVPSPGARERAIMRRGYRPGTMAGEAIRFVGQFKSFGITGLTKVQGRHIYGHEGTRHLRDVLSRGMGANVGLATAIAGTTMLGFFIYQAKQMMTGKEPRPLSAETLVAAALQGGGLGIYGDFLFGEANRFGGGTLETVMGPGVGTVAQAVDLLQRARGVVTGGDEDLRGDVLRLAKANIPFANLFYTKGAMDYLVWYQLQEMMNPGYLKRMERRVKRENNQGYWLPPSSIVATGGGFK